MYLQTILILVATTRVYSLKGCQACLDGVCYSKTPILNHYKVSGQLALDRNENIVYFHYETKQKDYTAGFDLDDILLKLIPNIDFSFAKAVDQTNREVYFGGATGIYKYNPLTNITVPYALQDKTIWQLQYKDAIYYTEFKTKGLYTIENKQSKSVTPLANFTIDDFIIDYQDDIYFLSDSKVYRLKKGANEPLVFLNDVYSLSVDNSDRPHFINSGKRGLYRLKNDKLHEVGAIGNGVPLKSVFDNNNNIIYSENNSRIMYYLMPNLSRCRVSSKSIKPRRKFSKNDSNYNFNNSTLYIEMIS